MFKLTLADWKLSALALEAVLMQSSCQLLQLKPLLLLILGLREAFRLNTDTFSGNTSRTPYTVALLDLEVGLQLRSSHLALCQLAPGSHTKPDFAPPPN